VPASHYPEEVRLRPSENLLVTALDRYTCGQSKLGASGLDATFSFVGEAEHYVGLCHRR
jgi:hypothetical protein